jgi:sodium-dependent phosphate cotransporter
VGTTITAILASFVTGSEAAVAVAFAHLIFNVTGIVLIWPIKRVPIYMAEALATAALKSKLIPLAYILIVFFVIPGILIYFAG